MSDSFRLFILSLKTDVKRRDQLTEKLDHLGIEYEIFFAIDGRQGLPKEILNQIDRAKTIKKINREMTDGEYACALSHQSIYKKIIKDNIDWAAILEDDALIDSRLKEFIEKKSYKKSHLIHLYHTNTRVFPFFKKELINGIFGKYIATAPFGTVGYSISRHAAEYLVKHSLPISHYADWPCDITPLVPLAADPRIVEHPPIAASTDLSKNRPKVRKSMSRLLLPCYWKTWIKKRLSIKLNY